MRPPMIEVERPRLALKGQWWERYGYVLFLPHGQDPNIPNIMTGWQQVTEQRAREVVNGWAPAPC